MPTDAPRAPASRYRLALILAFASGWGMSAQSRMNGEVSSVLGAPAQAHDTLLESDPADGATLETSPEAITLTYSADILEVSPLVRITDESGEQLAEITPSVDGPVATATLEEPLPAGTSTVQWRVVSSDGHPIEGTFEVTVEQDAAVEETTEAPAEESSPA